MPLSFETLEEFLVLFLAFFGSGISSSENTALTDNSFLSCSLPISESNQTRKKNVYISENDI